MLDTTSLGIKVFSVVSDLEDCIWLSWRGGKHDTHKRCFAAKGK